MYQFLPILLLFYLFLYNYNELIKVTNKLDKVNDVEEIRDNNDTILLEQDTECLYNHNNLCQQMLKI